MVTAAALLLLLLPLLLLRVPTQGWRDLGARALVTPLDPACTFVDDPLRALRGVRFAARLGFDLDAAALAAMADKRVRPAAEGHAGGGGVVCVC